MKQISIAILVSGSEDSGRDALTEEKYRDLGLALSQNGYLTRSVLYSDERVESIYKSLLEFDALLVWINPIEQGRDRRKLDAMLVQLANAGRLVSCHPDTILKMGTKDILFKTRDMDWGGDIKIYSSYEEFAGRFMESLDSSGLRILKQYRGNGGQGVFKIRKGTSLQEVHVIPAGADQNSQIFSKDAFLKKFSEYFQNGGSLIDQAWNEHLENGMVRCYLCGNKVAGFGYQEINMLYEIKTRDGIIQASPGKRYYFTEHCGLFNDLREIMEEKWVPELQEKQSIPDRMLPLIWDADFFINDPAHQTAVGKYSLCEINVSSVSPFPPSAIKFIVAELGRRLGR